MMEATQRAANPLEATKTLPVSLTRHESARTENLEPLAFKVPKAFRKRFKQRALSADLKLNELLFEALDAWEDKQGLKRK